MVCHVTRKTQKVNYQKSNGKILQEELQSGDSQYTNEKQMEPSDSIQLQHTWKNLWEQILCEQFKVPGLHTAVRQTQSAEQTPQLGLTSNPSQERLLGDTCAFNKAAITYSNAPG